MTNEKCNRFDYCSVPLCPVDKQSLRDCVWYPDEEICSLRKYTKSLMISNQKKIKKVVNDTETYFNKQMLEKHITITKNLKGLDPDKPFKPQFDKWIKNNPERKPLSQTEIEKRRENIKKINRRLDV